MAKRGTLYRCHLCSFLFGGDGPQTPGLDVTWTRSLQPVQDTTVLSGTLVELYGRIDPPGPKLSPDSRVRFDILEEDFLLTGGLDDRIDSLVGTNARPPDEGFRVLQRETEYVTLGDNECVSDFIDYLRRNRAPAYRDRIYLLEEPGDAPVFHVLTFWEATRREDYADSEYYFILNIDEDVDDQTEQTLNVTSDTLPSPASGAALDEKPPETDIDFTIVGDAINAVFDEFESEQQALKSGWQPPDVGAPAPAEDGGAIKAAARQQVRTAQAPPPERIAIDIGLEPWPFAHPQGPVEQDVVKVGTSPFEDSAIAIMRSWDTFRPSGDRYAVSGDFNRAIRWGQLLFGARAFAVIEGPLVSENPRYYTVRTNLRYALGANAFVTLPGGGSGFVGVDVRYWQIEQRDGDRKSYMVRLIGTTDNAIIIPNYPAHRDETCTQLIGNCPFDWRQLESVIPHEQAEREVFAQINEALGQKREDDAARMLIELNWNAFALVSLERRGEFLRILLDSITIMRRTLQANIGERIEIAILEIVHSVKTPDELKRVVGVLQGHSEIQLIVGRMDSKFWTLLTDIGERLGEGIEIRVDKAFIFNLFQDSIGGNAPLLGIGLKVHMRPDESVEIDRANLDEIYTIGNTFLNFGKGMIEGFAMLIQHPDKVLEGVWALLKGLAMIQLAGNGVPFAQKWVDEKLVPGIKQLAKGLLNGWRGAQILGDALGGDEGRKLFTDIVMRVKWAIVWEVASFFIGVGEIADAVKVVARGVEEAAGMLRVSKAVTTGEEAVGKLTKFSELASATGGMGKAGEAQRLLTHLPANDIKLLERTLANAETRSFRSLDALAAQAGPEGEKALSHVAERMKALQTIESRVPGRLANDGADAFERLTQLPGASNERLGQVLGSMTEREMNNLLDTASRIPPSALGREGAIPFETVRTIANRPQSYNALAREGYDAVSSMLRQSGGDVRLMEKNFDALRVIRGQASSEAEGAALANRVLQGETEAVADLANARRTLDVMKGRCFL
jgi:hypothetical protein